MLRSLLHLCYFSRCRCVTLKDIPVVECVNFNQPFQILDRKIQRNRFPVSPFKSWPTLPCERGSDVGTAALWKDPRRETTETTRCIPSLFIYFNLSIMSRGKHWITEPDQELMPTIGEKGYASKKPVTIVEAFRTTVAKHGNCNALASQTKVDVRAIYAHFTQHNRVITSHSSSFRLRASFPTGSSGAGTITTEIASLSPRLLSSWRLTSLRSLTSWASTR